MADNDQEKQHLPTGKRIADLRRRGNVMRSRDLSGGLLFTVSVGLIILMSLDFKQLFQRNFITAFSSIPYAMYETSYITTVLRQLMLNTFDLLVPIFCILFITAFLSAFVFGGWNFTLEALQLKFEKLDPTTGIMRILAPTQAMIEIIRSMIKAFFFLGVLFSYFIVNRHSIFNLSKAPTLSAIYLSCFTVKGFIIILCASLLFTILFDIAYQQYRYLEQAKMTTQELKDEHKDIEGNMEKKRKVRSKQIALLKQRLIQSVPTASVVITNLTHYAVALRYHNGKDKAPKVVAKGKGYIAHQIRQIAIANGVTIYQAPPLARAIYHSTKLNHEVHPGLYKAVAIVLTYVYQLKNYQMGSG